MNAPRQPMLRQLGYVALLGLPLLSGCTTHYRESLDAFHAGEPSAYYQRTMAWAGDQPDSDDTEVMVSASAPDENTPAPLAAPSTPNQAALVAARVLGLSPETFAAQSAPFADKASLDTLLSDRLEWRELLMAVTLGSPRVEASRQAWEATLHQYSQAEFLEGLLREYKTFTRYLALGAGEPLQKDMNREFFPAPSSLAYKGEMIREQVRLAELDWERVLRTTLVEAGTVYFDYQFQYQGAKTVDENVTLLANLIGVVQDRYATGLASQPDVLRLQTALERQRKLLRDFEARKRATAAQLNALLGRPANAPLGAPAAKELPYRAEAPETFVATALAHRQEVGAQAARIARTEIAIRMGELMNRPLFTQGYSTLDRGMMADASVEAPAMPYGSSPDAAVTRPAYGQAEAYLGEMRQRLDGEKATLEQLKRDTEALVHTLLEQADIAHRQTLLIGDIVLPLDQSTYDITLRAYTVGELTFLDLLDAERKLIDTRLELDESRRDRNQAVLQIANVRGFLDSEGR